jgi:hypothetical protein
MPEIESNVYTIAEYCAAEKISRSHVYNEWRAGRGPRSFKRGSRTLISREAARDRAGARRGQRDGVMTTRDPSFQTHTATS